MKKLITVCCVSAGLLLPMTFTATAKAEPVRHPEIREAIRALENAKEHLKAANHDFGGHREAAIKACNEAIEQLKLALEHGG